MRSVFSVPRFGSERLVVQIRNLFSSHFEVFIRDMEIARPKKHTGLQKKEPRTKTKEPRQKNAGPVIFIRKYATFRFIGTLKTLKAFKPQTFHTFQMEYSTSRFFGTLQMEYSTFRFIGTLQMEYSTFRFIGTLQTPSSTSSFYIEKLYPTDKSTSIRVYQRRHC